MVELNITQCPAVNGECPHFHEEGEQCPCSECREEEEESGGEYADGNATAKP